MRTLTRGLTISSNSVLDLHVKCKKLRWQTKALRNKDSPIYGWPIGLVEKALRNLATDGALAKKEYQWPIPLTIKYYHPWLLQILEDIWDFGHSALVMLGEPGAGKIPLGRSLLMAQLVSRQWKNHVSAALQRLISYEVKISNYPKYFHLRLCMFGIFVIFGIWSEGQLFLYRIGICKKHIYMKNTRSQRSFLKKKTQCSGTAHPTYFPLQGMCAEFVMRCRFFPMFFNRLNGSGHQLQ